MQKDNPDKPIATFLAPLMAQPPMTRPTVKATEPTTSIKTTKQMRGRLAKKREEELSLSFLHRFLTALPVGYIGPTRPALPLCVISPCVTRIGKMVLSM